MFVASGVWHPDRHALTKIRDAIVAHPQRWQHVISSKAFRATGCLGGDSLKRHPSGYDPEHPLLADLKRKDYIALPTSRRHKPVRPILWTSLPRPAGLLHLDAFSDDRTGTSMVGGWRGPWRRQHAHHGLNPTRATYTALTGESTAWLLS